MRFSLQPPIKNSIFIAFPVTTSNEQLRVKQLTFSGLESMPIQKQITFVAAVNKRDILERNFLASPCFRTPHPHQILIQEGFASASNAYNDAIDKSTNDLIVFIHQDVILPEGWLDDLERALIGLFGTRRPTSGASSVVTAKHFTTTDGVTSIPLDLGFWESRLSVLLQIQTLDEIVLIPCGNRPACDSTTACRTSTCMAPISALGLKRGAGRTTRFPPLCTQHPAGLDFAGGSLRMLPTREAKLEALDWRSRPRAFG